MHYKVKMQHNWSPTGRLEIIGEFDTFEHALQATLRTLNAEYPGEWELNVLQEDSAQFTHVNGYGGASVLALVSPVETPEELAHAQIAELEDNIKTVRKQLAALRTRFPQITGE